LNLEILTAKIQEFLEANLTEKASKIALQKSPFSKVSSKELAQQLVGKQKAKAKLPTWFSSTLVYYPPSLNLEQTSSEKTAHYKAGLVSGDTLIDVTGGFGIDSVAFAEKISQVYHCELNSELQEIASYNFKALGLNNISSNCGDGIDYTLNSEPVDWIYIDPSRRNESKGKVFFLEDCLPNVPEIVDQLVQKATSILIKTAPILDISVGLKALKYVKEIHIVAVNNEVKELLWILDKSGTTNPKIHMATLYDTFENKLEVDLNTEQHSLANYGSPSAYLYEPYAAIMKAGVFNWLSAAFDTLKLHPQTHLYTSSKQIDFPGRKFEIIAVYPFTKSSMRSLIKSKTNVVSKNFKLSVAEIRKKYKLQEGLEYYLFFVTDSNNKPIVINCKKISN